MNARCRLNQHEGASADMLPLVGITDNIFWAHVPRAFLSPWGHRATLVSVRGATRAISVFTEVIRAVILPIQATTFFFKPSVKSTSVASHAIVSHHAWLVWTPRGHCGRSAQVKPTRRGQHNYVAPDQGSSMIFVGPATIEAILPPREHRVTLVSTQGGTRFHPSRR